MAPQVHTEFFEIDTTHNPSFGLIAGSNLAGADHNTTEDRLFSSMIRGFLACVPSTNFCEKFDQNSAIEHRPISMGFEGFYILSGIRTRMAHACRQIEKSKLPIDTGSNPVSAITMHESRCAWPPIDCVSSLSESYRIITGMANFPEPKQCFFHIQVRGNMRGSLYHTPTPKATALHAYTSF